MMESEGMQPLPDGLRIVHGDCGIERAYLLMEEELGICALEPENYDRVRKWLEEKDQSFYCGQDKDLFFRLLTLPSGPDRTTALVLAKLAIVDCQYFPHAGCDVVTYADVDQCRELGVDTITVEEVRRFVSEAAAQFGVRVDQGLMTIQQITNWPIDLRPEGVGDDIDQVYCLMKAMSGGDNRTWKERAETYKPDEEAQKCLWQKIKTQQALATYRELPTEVRVRIEQLEQEIRAEAVKIDPAKAIWFVRSANAMDPCMILPPGHPLQGEGGTSWWFFLYAAQEGVRGWIPFLLLPEAVQDALYANPPGPREEWTPEKIDDERKRAEHEARRAAADA
jgi:hypothetical protein